MARPLGVSRDKQARLRAALFSSHKNAEPEAPEDIHAHVAYWKRLNKELREAGELVSVEALSAPAHAKRVRADQNGLPLTDGVFPETKEFLAGYWIVDVDSAERAYAIAAQASAAPGPGASHCSCRSRCAR